MARSKRKNIDNRGLVLAFDLAPGTRVLPLITVTRYPAETEIILPRLKSGTYTTIHTTR
jgi:hypothetical protein